MKIVHDQSSLHRVLKAFFSRAWRGNSFAILSRHVAPGAPIGILPYWTSSATVATVGPALPQGLGFCKPECVTLALLHTESVSVVLNLVPEQVKLISANSMSPQGNNELQPSDTATFETDEPLMFLKWTSEIFHFDGCQYNNVIWSEKVSRKKIKCTYFNSLTTVYKILYIFFETIFYFGLVVVYNFWVSNLAFT